MCMWKKCPKDFFQMEGNATLEATKYALKVYLDSVLYGKAF